MVTANGSDWFEIIIRERLERERERKEREGQQFFQFGPAPISRAHISRSFSSMAANPAWIFTGPQRRVGTG